MYTVHHPARTIEAYDEVFYDLEELDAAARDRAIEGWIATFGDCYTQDACDDIRRALDHVLDQLPTAPRETLHYDALMLSTMYAHEWAAHITGKVEDAGDCYSMDIADAYNAHADEIDRLAEAYNTIDYGTPDYYTAEADLNLAVNDALDDVAKVANRLWDFEYAYYHGWAEQRDGLAEFISGCDFVFDAEGNRYDRSIIAA